MLRREKKECIGEDDSKYSVIILGIPNMIIADQFARNGDAVYSNSSRAMCTILVFSLLLLVGIFQGVTKGADSPGARIF